MDVKIYVTTHKKSDMPSDELYVPLHCGRINSTDLGYIGDDTGDNISDRNAFYSEVTGLYWIWKHDKSEYVGLSHYRRFFHKPTLTYGEVDKDNPFALIIDQEDIEFYMQNYDIILPIKSHPYNKTVRDAYCQFHYKSDLDLAEKIIKDFYPEYGDTFDEVMVSSYAYYCNLFVCKKSIIDKYCEWVFSIFFEMEKFIDATDRNSYQQRWAAFLAERLFTIWITKQNFRIKEMDVYSPNSERSEGHRLSNDLEYSPIRDYSDIHTSFETGTDGCESVSVTINANKVFLSGEHDEQHDIENLMEQIGRVEGTFSLVVFGMGSGTFINRLLALTPYNTDLIIVEPNQEILLNYIRNRKYLHIKEPYRVRVVLFDKSIGDKMNLIRPLYKQRLICYSKYAEIYFLEYLMLKTCGRWDNV